MTRSRWIIFAVIVIATLVGLVAFSRKDRVDVGSVDHTVVVTEGDTADHVYGNPDAKVTIIEYADFQCPGCQAAAPKLGEIKETYKESVRFVFRHFPLTSIHPNALIAAYAAEAAGQQGKFWEMHDLLFENQAAWSQLGTSERTEKFREYAGQLQLDLSKFDADLTSKRISGKISYDRALANKIGVNSTPTVYVNGEKLSNDEISDVVQKDGQLLRDKLDKAIRDSGGTPPSAASTED